MNIESGGEKKAESIEQKISGAKDIEELENILKEIGEVRGTKRRIEEGGRIKEETKIYSSEELIKRIDTIQESISFGPDETQGIPTLETITSSEGLREEVGRLLVESSNNWKEFTHWIWLVVSDSELGRKLEGLTYYHEIIEQAKDDVRTIVDENGKPHSIEDVIPEKCGLRSKFIELMRQQSEKKAA